MQRNLLYSHHFITNHYFDNNVECIALCVEEETFTNCSYKLAVYSYPIHTQYCINLYQEYIKESVQHTQQQYKRLFQDLTSQLRLQWGVNMISKYLNYNTTATKPCTLSASSAPAVWLHGHKCGTSTRCCNYMLTSNPERDVCTTTVPQCVAHSL